MSLRQSFLAISLGILANACGAQTPLAMGTTQQSAPTLSQQQKAGGQEERIQELEAAVHQRDNKIEELQRDVLDLRKTTSEILRRMDLTGLSSNQSPPSNESAASLQSAVADLTAAVKVSAVEGQNTRRLLNSFEAPFAIRYKGITITPGGYVAAETAWRQRALAADVGTPLNSIPFSNTTQGNLSEFIASSRQSRLSAYVEGRLSATRLSAYVESDFLSAGVTSDSTQSNGYNLRLRQLWGQASLDSGWTFTGGQMWSLVTETRKGVENRAESVPMTIDPQYTAGFSWARQDGFRVSKHFGNVASVALSAENPQLTLSVQGNDNNFVVGSEGSSSGELNSTTGYSLNPYPDFIQKGVWESSIGHYEIFALERILRDRIFPCASTSAGVSCEGIIGPSGAGAYNSSTVAGGIGGNLRFGTKGYSIGAHFLGGNAIGRYGSATLPDATVRPNGALVPLRNYQALGTLERYSSRVAIYTNLGVEYVGRAAYTDQLGQGEGYGSPLFHNSGCFEEPAPANPVNSSGSNVPPGYSLGSQLNCAGDTRAVGELTLGGWLDMYRGPMGRLRFGSQYSYVSRRTWRGMGGSPTGMENMFMSSFRYYLP